MVAGIALLGVVTASIASWFVESVRANDRETERVEAQLAEVLVELKELRARLDAREAPRAGFRGTGTPLRYPSRGLRRVAHRPDLGAGKMSVPGARMTLDAPRPVEIMIMAVWYNWGGVRRGAR